MTYFPKPDRWLIPHAAWTEAFKEMARDGLNGNEGVALWLGKHGDGTATITHVVKLRGRDVHRQPALLEIGADTMNEVTDLTIEYAATLVGQIHAHGQGYGTDLSLTDRRYGIAVPGYLSLVAPDYAMRPSTSVVECGVHVFKAGFGFRRLSNDEVERRIEVTDSADVQVVTVGG